MLASEEPRIDHYHLFKLPAEKFLSRRVYTRQHASYIGEIGVVLRFPDNLLSTIPTSYILNNVPETTSKLPNPLMLSADFVRKGLAEGYSGSGHEEIVISGAFAEAVFPRTG